MKNLIKYILIIALLLPGLAQAKDLSKLSIIPVTDINNQCRATQDQIDDTENIIGGCYYTQTETIFFNINAPKEYWTYVILHEIGHWLMDGGTEELADQFAWWLMGKPTDKKVIDYFIELIK